MKYAEIPKALPVRLLQFVQWQMPWEMGWPETVMDVWEQAQLPVLNMVSALVEVANMHTMP